MAIKHDSKSDPNIKHNSKWEPKRLLAVGAMVMALSGFFGSTLGTRFSGNPPRVPTQIVVINNYPNSAERRDATAELIPILKRLANKQITLDVAIAEIGRVLPIRQLGGEFIEKIKPILIRIIGTSSDKKINEGVDAIAKAFEESSKALPTPLPESPIYVRPSP
jgi:hypothetical protein